MFVLVRAAAFMCLALALAISTGCSEDEPREASDRTKRWVRAYQSQVDDWRVQLEESQPPYPGPDLQKPTAIRKIQRGARRVERFANPPRDLDNGERLHRQISAAGNAATAYVVAYERDPPIVHPQGPDALAATRRLEAAAAALLGELLACERLIKEEIEATGASSDAPSPQRRALPSATG